MQPQICICGVDGRILQIRDYGANPGYVNPAEFIVRCAGIEARDVYGCVTQGGVWIPDVKK
jgi:hypothetical protein